MGERTAAEEGINQTGTRRYRGIQNRRRIALASRRWKEDLRAADYFPIIYLGTSGEGGGGSGADSPGSGFPASEVEEEEKVVDAGGGKWRSDAYCCWRERASAHD